jgi:hypothetical protein
MIKRLEQVAALVVAAGLAIVSYWLFFSWAGGGDANRRHQPSRSVLPWHDLRRSQPASGFEQPAVAVAIVHPRQVFSHLLGGDGQTLGLTDGHNLAQGSAGILQGLAEQGLGELGVAADPRIELGGIAGGHRG